MLRSCPLLAMLLLLTACVSVDDFGAYWAQARLDPALTGRWQKQPDANSDGKVEQLVFTPRDQAHEVNGFVDGKPADDPPKPLYPVKALTLGQNHFLLQLEKNPGGNMVRYKLENHVLVFYSLQLRARSALPKPPDTVKFAGDEVSVTQLDKAAAQWLAGLPDANWLPISTYRPVP